VDRRWVLNSSPIIVLSKTSLIRIERALSAEIVVPEAVAYEINEGAASDPAKKWLEEEGKAHIRDVGTVDPMVLSWKLGRGESEVISWANRNPRYEAIIDDRAARRCASALGLQVRGTIGVLLAAKKSGLIPALAPVRGLAKDSGFRISDTLLDKAPRSTPSNKKGERLLSSTACSPD
jgi:predicted nucleic acid-binding protein